ncbi:MAG: penicillin-binding transpeptidase domain-containing protein [Ilumatobacter sp.]
MRHSTGTLLATAFAVLVAACSRTPEPSTPASVTESVSSLDATALPNEAEALPALPRPAGASAVLDRNGQELGWLRYESGEASAVPLAVDAFDLIVDEATSSSSIEAALSVAPGTPISTSIDLELQSLLQQAVGQVPSTAGRFEVAAVAVEVATGAVVAVVDSSPGSSLARLTRPTGSVLKFVVALAAIDAGVSERDLIDGAQRCSVPTSGDANAAPPLSFSGDDRFAPGEISMITAFSVNCAFAKLHQIVGGDVVSSMARQLGFDGVVDDSPRLVIGASDASPLQMARAMSVVLGNGTLNRPGFVTAVDGDASAAIRVQQSVVVDAATAATTASLLRGVVEVGTASEFALADGRQGAGKTGTQENNTDAWFVGGTPELSIAVWIGNPADPSDSMVAVDEFVGVGRVQGGSYPAAVWKHFVDAALAGSSLSTWSVEQSSRQPVQLVLPGLECSAAPLLDVAFPAVAIDSNIIDCS